MRILVFSWRDLKHPLAGGAEQVMHEHMKGWVKAGHEVTLLSSKLNNVPKEEVIDGIKIKRSGGQYLGVQLAGFFYYLQNKDDIDLVVDQFHGIPFFCPIYVRKPILAVIQETARNVWFLNPFPKPFNWIVGLIGYLGEPFIFLLYRKVNFMTGSASAKEDVKKFGIEGNNINVIPHGVIVKRPNPWPVKEKQFTIVFLGVLSKDKGIEDALQCISILKSDPYIQFWVIGKTETEEYGKKINRLAMELELKDKVKFWGYVSQEKKFELLARAHLLINPSCREGWGLVNIEANSMGIPVAAYRSPGLVDSVKDGLSGILCTQNTPSDLAKLVVELFEDKRKYQGLREGSLLWSKRFSWNRSSNLSLELLQRCL